MLKYRLMSEKARSPVRGTPMSAGVDLFSAEDKKIPAGERVLVSTDLQVILPDGCYGRLAPRSGLAFRNWIDVAAGVIDPDYQGVVKVLLVNSGKHDFSVMVGDRIAQLVCERMVIPELVQYYGPVESSVRGTGGFGSTGVKETDLTKKVED